MIDDQIQIHSDQILQSFSPGMLAWGPLVEEKNGMCMWALRGGECEWSGGVYFSFSESTMLSPML